MIDPTSPADPRHLPSAGTAELSGDPFLHVSGGGYFYLDNKDRVVVPTNTRHVFVIAEGGPTGFQQVADYDLTGVVPAGVGVLSDMPDWKGHIWFAAENGTVGWIDRRSGAIHARNLSEQIANSLAADETGGVYIVTTRALYRLRAAAWEGQGDLAQQVPELRGDEAGAALRRLRYDADPVGKNEVAITDNAKRMHVLVYTRGRKGGGRVDLPARRVPGGRQ